MSAENQRILVVEDQGIIAADLEMTLRRLGYRVVGTAATGEQAVEKASALEPDLVLMDIRLRGPMDGIEAAGIIRQRVDVPIVYLTAYADEETILRAKLTTPFGYVVKPFNERELRAAIEIALYKQRADRSLAEERARRLVADESRLLVECIEDYGIFRLDPRGRIASWNVGAQRLDGWSADEVIGEDFSMFFPAEEVEAGVPARVLALALAEGRAEHEGWRMREGTKRYWAHVTFTALPSPDGGTTSGYAVIVRDLSERRAYEQALRESEQRFRTAVVHAPVPMMVHAEDGEVLAVSDAVVSETGYPRDRLRRSDDWLDLAYGERAEEIRGLLQRAFEGQTPPPTELPVTVASGETRNWLFSISRPLVLAGNRRALVAVAVDVTDQRQAEDALLEQHRQKDQFIAMLGHELRNPLAALQSATELLEIMARRDPELQRTQDVLKRQITHMAKLVEGLLDVSRLIRGRISIDRSALDLRAVLEDAIRDRSDQVQRRGLELHVDVQDEGLWVNGDGVRLAQVFDNLLSNAVAFTDPPGRIAVAARREGDAVVVSIKDTGTGIDPDLLPHVFEPFRQADQPLGRTRGGLGLGLAIVKGVVELHEGTVSIESRRGSGTEVVVRMPLAAPAEKSVASPRSVASRKRVLVIEDNEDAAEMLCQLLVALGNDVKVAHDGESGLKAARAFAPDVVLCDIGLPGTMSGYDVARALRADRNEARLVAITGYGRPDDVRKATEAGFDAHLTKPVELSTLTSQLEECHRASA